MNLLPHYHPKVTGTTTALETPTYVGQRSNVRSTVNFIIPSDEMYGYLRLNIKVSGGSGRSDLLSK